MSNIISEDQYQCDIFAAIEIIFFLPAFFLIGNYDF